MRDREWLPEPVPREVVTVVRDKLGDVVASVVDAVAADSEAYADVLTGPEGMAIRLGIEQAIRAFLDAIERRRRPSSDTGELWRRLGEAELQSGRGLDELRAAFRTGTRAAWRSAADLAAGAGIPTNLVIALAEAIFVFTDELSSDVVEGYLRAQSDEAGELERRRRRLVQLLIDPETDPESTHRAAALARWPVPRDLAVLALSGGSALTATRRLGGDALVGGDHAGVFLVVPDPDGPGRRAVIDRAAGVGSGEIAALGPVVSARDAGRSLRWARELLSLVAGGVVTGGRASGPALFEDHLPELVVGRDAELAEALRARWLAPLLELGSADRDRLTETLAAWLDQQRRTPQIAAALNVHPQTVRYRIGQLRELLGDAIDTADGRFALALALRAEPRRTSG